MFQLSATKSTAEEQKLLVMVRQMTSIVATDQVEET
jgi:hypothetical protein